MESVRIIWRIYMRRCHHHKYVFGWRSLSHITITIFQHSVMTSPRFLVNIDFEHYIVYTLYIEVMSESRSSFLLSQQIPHQICGIHNPTDLRFTKATSMGKKANTSVVRCTLVCIRQTTIPEAVDTIRSVLALDLYYIYMIYKWNFKCVYMHKRSYWDICIT